MEATLTLDIQLADVVAALSEELYQFLTAFQNGRFKDPAWMDSARRKCEELAEKVSRASDSAAAARDSWRSRMADARQKAVARRDALSRSLERMRVALASASAELEQRPSVNRWREVCATLGEGYEEVMAHVRKMRDPRTDAKIRVVTLKPPNYARNIFHIAMGVGAVLAWELVLTWGLTMWILGGLCGIALILETTRRLSAVWNNRLMHLPVFRQVARPRERHRINGATMYLFALAIMAAVAPMEAVEIGLLVLAFADPMASLAGKRWGKHRIYAQKSLEGGAAFFFTALLVVGGFLAIKRGFDLSLFECVALALAAATTGTVVETMSGRLDDNFTVLIMTAGVCSLFF